MARIAKLEEEARKRISILKEMGYSPESIGVRYAEGGEIVPIVSLRSVLVFGEAKKIFGEMYTDKEFDRIGDLSGERKVMTAIDKFEEENDSLVYAVTVDKTIDGETWLTFLYVSDCPEEWELDRQDLKEGRPYAYVDTGNLYSEFGRVGIKVSGGGLLRVA